MTSAQLYGNTKAEYEAALVTLKKDLDHNLVVYINSGSMAVAREGVHVKYSRMQNTTQEGFVIHQIDNTNS